MGGPSEGDQRRARRREQTYEQVARLGGAQRRSARRVLGAQVRRICVAGTSRTAAIRAVVRGVRAPTASVWSTATATIAPAGSSDFGATRVPDPALRWTTASESRATQRRVSRHDARPPPQVPHGLVGLGSVKSRTQIPNPKSDPDPESRIPNPSLRSSSSASRDRCPEAPRLRHRHLHPQPAAAARADRSRDRVRPALPRGRPGRRRAARRRTSAPCSNRRRNYSIREQIHVPLGAARASSRTSSTRRTTCCRR